ncbi:MAG: hypothetical protein VKO64_08475 [Candidatus Sericytochromatia bacterium]|nr:hypothetical protein [Candidatus Sericytochromatia bacterium]
MNARIRSLVPGLGAAALGLLATSIPAWAAPNVPVPPQVPAGNPPASPTPSAPTAAIEPLAEDLKVLGRRHLVLADEVAAQQNRLDTLEERMGLQERRLVVGGALQFLHRSYGSGVGGPDDFRVQTDLRLSADLAPELSWQGDLLFLGNGFQQSASGFQSAQAANPSVAANFRDEGSVVHVRRSALTWVAEGQRVQLGLLRLAEALPVSPSLGGWVARAPLWPNGEGGYGYVGQPPIQDGAIRPMAVTDGSGRNGRLPMHPGTDVVRDLLHPAAAEDLIISGAPGASWQMDWGPLALGALIHDGIPGVSAARARQILPGHFPQPTDPRSGYGLLRLGTDLGWFRASMTGHLANGRLGEVFDTAKSAGKGLGVSMDIGDPGLGATLSWAQVRRAGDDGRHVQEASLQVGSESLLGSGVGLSLASRLGLAPFANRPGLAGPTLADLQVADGKGGIRTARIPVVPYNWVSSGVVLRFPGIPTVPGITLAAQTSGWDLLDSNFGSGLTALVELAPHPVLPRLFVQYDMGKYGPGENPLWSAGGTGNTTPAGGSQTAPITHEQLVLGSRITF